MSPTPHILGRVPFGAFDPASVSPALSDAIIYSRDRAASLILPLEAKRKQVTTDKNLSDEGKDAILSQHLNSVRVDLHVGFDVPIKLAEHALDSTTRKINQSMFADIDKPGALAQPHAELLALVPRDLVKLPTTGDGGVLLEAGTPFHQLLARVLLTAPINAARLAALSVVRASPFLSVLLGGQPVIDTVVRVLETRLAAEDPAVAELVSERTAAVAALAVVKGDLNTATVAAHRAAFGRAPSDNRARSAS